MIVLIIGLTFVTTIAKTFHAGGRRTDLAAWIERKCRGWCFDVWKVMVVTVTTLKSWGFLFHGDVEISKKNHVSFFGGGWSGALDVVKMTCGSVSSIDGAFHRLPCQSEADRSEYLGSNGRQCCLFPKTWRWTNAAEKRLIKVSQNVQSIQSKMFDEEMARCLIKKYVWIWSRKFFMISSLGCCGWAAIKISIRLRYWFNLF